MTALSAGGAPASGGPPHPIQGTRKFVTNVLLLTAVPVVLVILISKLLTWFG